MRPEIDDLLATCGGAASRAQLLRVVSRNQLDDEVARRRLVAVFARAYCRPWDVDHLPVREVAAVASVGAPVGLSHLSALRRLALLPDTEAVHVTATFRRHPVGRAPGLVVHRTRVRTPLCRIDGAPVVRPEFALTRSWPLLPVIDRRGPVIEAVRRRLVSPAQLRAAHAHTVGMAGRGDLAALIGLLEAGCESELEIWGHLGVFGVPGLRHATRQREVAAGGRRYRLDLAYDEEMVAVELDGARWHSAPERAERDRRRDAALAATGWLTLRFSWRRLHQDVDGVRRDTLATLAARREGSRVWRRSG